MVRREKEDGFAVKRICRLGICLLAAASSVATATTGSLNARRMNGSEYVAVGDLARFYNLGPNRSGAPDRAVYRNSYAELSLEAERRDIQLNGVTHWLGAPALSARGQLWISATDVLKTLDPVWRQGRSRSTGNVRTVVLDPGHGGADRGARGRAGVEKTLTLDLAKRVRRVLEARGVRVRMTRLTDRTLSLERRVEIAKECDADLVVSLHFNSGGSAEGIETFCIPPAGSGSTANPSKGSARGDNAAVPGNRYDEQNVWLAHCVQKSLLRATGAPDRGVRRARFQVIRQAACPAVLVESGFLTNPREEEKILRVEYRELLAGAIAEGILAYKSAVERR